MVKLIGVFLLCLVATLVRAEHREVFLPPDTDEVTIVGNGFRLRIDQLMQVKNDWKEAEKESAEVVSPRNPEEPVANDNLFAETKAAGEKNYGSVDLELLRWITNRATQLADRVTRYETEVQIGGVNLGSRVVAEILFLNTIVDLENLTKENIKSLRWIKNKLKRINRFGGAFENEILAYVTERIEANKGIERKIKRSNNPGEKWLTNTSSIKRILTEQRFSTALSKTIIDYLAGKFSMMERSRVYDLNKSDKNYDDELFYAGAKGRIPSSYPFSLQDAIMNGA